MIPALPPLNTLIHAEAFASHQRCMTALSTYLEALVVSVSEATSP